MDLRNHYKKLHSSALSSINKKGFNYDKELDNPSDLRRGLTLLIRPNKKIKEAFELFIHQAREVLPDQYFYSVDDIHVTVMPIVSCYSGFSMEGIEIDRYDEIIQKAIKDKKKVIELVKAFSDFEFGCQSFEQLEFVYNDWYQRKSIVQLLKSYNLKQ